MKFLVALMALIISITPVFAIEASEPELKPQIAIAEEQPVENEPVVAADSPPVLQPEPKDATFAEKHPVITFVPAKTTSLLSKTGHALKIDKLGVIGTKAKVATSDALVSLGKSTEKFHPGLQTICYGVQIATTIGIFLLKLK